MDSIWHSLATAAILGQASPRRSRYDSTDYLGWYLSRKTQIIYRPTDDFSM